MRNLIVNADDFGIHSSVNDAVCEAYEHGLLRSTSLIATGAAAEEAAEMSRERKGLSVGIHITLVAETPALPADQVKSLVGEDGKFLPAYGAFMKRYFSGGFDKAELYAECEAQILRAKDLGVKISHLDSHQHLHVLPEVLEVCFELMKKYHIPCMRIPAEPYMFTGEYPVSFFRWGAKCALSFLAGQAKSKAKQQGFRVPDAFFGMSAGGHMEEKYFFGVLKNLPDGVSEIMLHPGTDNKALARKYDWGYHWEEELSSVISHGVLQYTFSHGIVPISYHDL